VTPPPGPVSGASRHERPRTTPPSRDCGSTATWVALVTGALSAACVGQLPAARRPRNRRAIPGRARPLGGVAGRSAMDVDLQ
jgi:hypothetical protein